MSDARLTRIESMLRERGPQPAAALATGLQVSQPTVSRLLAQAGDRVVRIGRARATRYALGRDIARAGRRWPVYRIDADAQAQTLGELSALHGDRFHFEPVRVGALPAFLFDGFSDGLFPGLPWFLDDQRPQGFLGRAFARRVAGEIGASPDVLRWQPDDLILALLRHGDDAPGDLVLGETALQRAMQHALAPGDAFSADERSARYPSLAAAAMRGDVAGSSAGGEQPKFTATLRNGENYQPVIVKFSERAATPAGRRWADLLRAEQIAGEVLRMHGQRAAHGEVIESDGRVFLQSTRFDRTPVLGRCGFVSLAALDAAFYGHGRIDWWRFAAELHRDGWLTADDAHRLQVLGWFGALIANSDMHLGNAGMVLTDARPLTIAPAYDMLPMHFRPAASGEVVPRDYVVMLPTPEFRDDWRTAAAIARQFWQQLADAPDVSAAFNDIAGAADVALGQAIARLH